MSNPYAHLQDYQFWRRSVSRVEPHRFDPVVSPRFRVPAEAKVATAGSCFAQHISRKLASIGFNYFVTEDGEDLEVEERARRNFGVFSARFGNVYTTAQLHQLFEEAFGLRQPLETAWQRRDGRWVDPYRPQIEPDGFANSDDVRTARAEHLAAVRRMFEECEIFVFTLGLTEAWRSRRDGSVFPLAPGVAGGDYDPAMYEPVNFTVEEVAQDLRAVLQKLQKINPHVQVVLTVSPVPLIATFEDRSVLCSTVYSKSVLRVVADMMTRAFEWVEYFPSFEIITGSNAGGRYFGPDYRDVNHLGVAHAMRCFVNNYVLNGNADQERPGLLTPVDPGQIAVVCDEEIVAAARN